MVVATGESHKAENACDFQQSCGKMKPYVYLFGKVLTFDAGKCVLISKSVA